MIHGTEYYTNKLRETVMLQQPVRHCYDMLREEIVSTIDEPDMKVEEISFLDQAFERVKSELIDIH
ncbi:hypothetical protein [Bacillus marinisedimentorum]|uniref:hypothetical protein n=1 Tax=Bacillus marinisedimentorum TaxID=1821260 RepID=UPI000871B47B|nr:hypothetical protein [Bacillus marinisedimentorum]